MVLAVRHRLFVVEFVAIRKQWEGESRKKIPSSKQPISELGLESCLRRKEILSGTSGKGNPKLLRECASGCSGADRSQHHFQRLLQLLFCNCLISHHRSEKGIGSNINRNCHQNARERLLGDEPAEEDSHRIEEKEHFSKEIPWSQKADNPRDQVGAFFLNRKQII